MPGERTNGDQQAVARPRAWDSETGEPLYALCFTPKPDGDDYVNCDRMAGHKGRCSWDA
jgi:hypothetical protein